MEVFEVTGGTGALEVTIGTETFGVTSEAKTMQVTVGSETFKAIYN